MRERSEEAARGKRRCGDDELEHMELEKQSAPQPNSKQTQPAPALAVHRKVGCSLNNYWTSHLRLTVASTVGGGGERIHASGALDHEAAPLAAARVPRRPWTAPTTIPAGRVKG